MLSNKIWMKHKPPMLIRGKKCFLKILFHIRCHHKYDALILYLRLSFLTLEQYILEALSENIYFKKLITSPFGYKPAQKQMAFVAKADDTFKLQRMHAITILGWLWCCRLWDSLDSECNSNSVNLLNANIIRTKS